MIDPITLTEATLPAPQFLETLIGDVRISTIRQFPDHNGNSLETMALSPDPNAGPDGDGILDCVRHRDDAAARVGHAMMVARFRAEVEQCQQK